MFCSLKTQIYYTGLSTQEILFNGRGFRFEKKEAINVGKFIRTVDFFDSR